MHQASETAEGFDYMQGGKESSQAAAVAQEYMDKLLAESAPASYLPMLARLAKTTALPVPIRVCFPSGVWNVCLDTCMANTTCFCLELLMSLLELLMLCLFCSLLSLSCNPQLNPFLQPEAQCIPGK